MNNDQQYKYYKIIRLSDNFTSYCPVLNFVYEFFERLHGSPIEWNESEEKYNLKVKKDVIQVPLRIKAYTDDEEFLIKLSKQEYNYIPLKEL